MNFSEYFHWTKLLFFGVIAIEILVFTYFYKRREKLSGQYIKDGQINTIEDTRQNVGNDTAPISQISNNGTDSQYNE